MATKRTGAAVTVERRLMAWWMSGTAMRPGSPFVWHPPTNVYETVDGLVVQVEVAGLAADDFRIVLRPGRLTISGVRRPVPSLGNSTACLQVEIAGGAFRSEVDLPWPVDSSAVRAAYRHGFIFVELSRSGNGDT
jgi:HSP20 family molecular chaperone IbpA